tara:strand:- start:2498 stop:3448 length:951 start_codon:yes stop_codon:yes gene_type:complete
MASTLTSSTMTISINENITLNGQNQGGIITKSIASISNVFKRQITCPLDEITLYTTHGSLVSGNQFDSDLIKYARITNLDNANSVDIIITSATNDEVCRTLKAGETFLLWGHDASIFADGSALTVADAVTATANLSIADGDDATSGQFTEGEYVKFIATDGTVGIFILSDASETGAVASGTVLTSTSDLGTGVPSSSLLAAGTCIAVTMNLNTCTQALLLNELRDTMGSTNSPLLNKVSGASGTVPSSNGSQALLFTQAIFGTAGNTVTTTNISQLTAPDFTGGIDGGVASKLDIATITATAHTEAVDLEILVAST